MKSLPLHSGKKLLVIAMTSLLVVACSSAPKKPDGADAVRSKLTMLQSNPELASRAPVAIKDAEAAVRAAETPQKDLEEGRHLVWMADHKVDIAAARAESRLLEDQRAALTAQRESARLDSRTLEADKARGEAAAARGDADAARQQSEDLQRQLAELNAKETDRGMVITLGDVLFDTGKAVLKGGATSNLSKLAAFLNQYQDRTIAIEGHTDTVGSEDYNLGLSQRRADAVKSYLVSQGVNAMRITTAGKGEDTPIAGNETAAGRQQNRRVEVVIANTQVSSQ